MTETNTLTLNKGDTRNFERRVESVVVGQGRLIVTDGDRVKAVESGESYEANASTTISVFAVEGSNFAIDFTDNASAPAPITAPPVQRGDADADSATGGTGPYEDRTVKELRALAQKKDLSVPRSARKAEIIEVLRNA